MTTTTEVASRYREMRAKYPSAGATTALAWARTPDPEPLDWSPHGDRAELERDGFSVIVRVDIDEMPDPFVEFTNDDPSRDLGGEESLYRNPHAWHEGEIVERGVFAYVRPTEGGYDEHRRALAKYGHSRQDADTIARRYVRQSVEAATADDNPPCVLFVQVRRDGVELGGDSLGGVTLDPSRDPQQQLDEVVRDHGMIGNAIDEARDTLARLCAGR